MGQKIFGEHGILPVTFEFVNLLRPNLAEW